MARGKRLESTMLTNITQYGSTVYIGIATVYIGIAMSIPIENHI